MESSIHTCDEPIDQTEEYWRKLDGLVSRDKFLETLEWYVEHLLPLEMSCIKPRSTRPGKPCETLVLLVGYSLEPLLQAICFYQPCRVVLVLNRDYGEEVGPRMGKHIEELVRRLTHAAGDLSPLLSRMPDIGPRKKGASDEFLAIDADPVEVFQLLTDELRGTPSDRVVVDITGAKKSMVAGAFLYAAFTDVAISYVEFDDAQYDFVKGRPVGYLSAIQRLSNPYSTFALREWARVRTLYEGYRFREAHSLLVGPNGDGGEGTVLGVAEVYQSQAKVEIKQLGQVLKCYAHWDSGDFGEAKERLKGLEGFSPPSVVTQLGDGWLKVEGVSFVSIPFGFYDDTADLRIYVCDELERVKRLRKYNQDYRSAFLRAAGLNEVLMVARLVRLVRNANHRRELLGALDKYTPNCHSLFQQLTKKSGRTIGVRALYPRHQAHKVPDIGLTLKGPMTSWWSETTFKDDEGSPDRRGWQKFLDIRNKLAHTYLSVPEELAEAGFEFVRANFEDFLLADGVTIEQLGVSAERMPWKELCSWCGLDKILPPELVRNTRR
jgi:hypothetical protein